MDSGEPLVAEVFSIQHFCMHDGPGTRSVVFFTGCPLRCAWCSNPESWQRGPQLAFKRHLCLVHSPGHGGACHRCVDVCPTHAMAAPGSWDPDACDHCGECVRACPSEALLRLGEQVPLDALLAALRPEFGLYRRTGGGVTLSGGEATLQARVSLALVHALHAEGIHVTLETCGLYNHGDDVGALLAALQLVLCDIKLFDDAEHRRFCGSGNQRIKDNLERLGAVMRSGGAPVWPRMPVIPGVTASEANVRGWGAWLRERAFEQVTLVPYHEYGAGKREWLHMQEAPHFSVPDAEVLGQVRAWFEEYELRCFMPGEEPPGTWG